MTVPSSDGLFEALPFGLLLLDRSGRILSANAAAAVGPFRGLTLQGRDLFDDFPDLPDLQVARTRFETGVQQGHVSLLIGIEGMRIRIASIDGVGRAHAAAFVETLPPEEHLLGMEAAYVTLQRLVSETSHAVSNKLMGVTAPLELLQMRAELPRWVREKVDTAMKEAQRIPDLIKRLSTTR